MRLDMCIYFQTKRDGKQVFLYFIGTGQRDSLMQTGCKSNCMEIGSSSDRKTWKLASFKRPGSYNPQEALLVEFFRWDS
jgi:hypothetical protein